LPLPYLLYPESAARAPIKRTLPDGWNAKTPQLQAVFAVACSSFNTNNRTPQNKPSFRPKLPTA
jgi:hypothetical protein